MEALITVLKITKVFEGPCDPKYGSFDTSHGEGCPRKQH